MLLTGRFFSLFKKTKKDKLLVILSGLKTFNSAQAALLGKGLKIKDVRRTIRKFVEDGKIRIIKTNKNHQNVYSVRR